MRITIVALLAAAFSTAAAAQSLSGEQIRNALIGHTISGVEDGEAYSEHLNADGTISGRSPSGDYSGRWRITRDEICFRYDDDEDWDCNEVSLRGNKITWDDGSSAALSEER